MYCLKSSVLSNGLLAVLTLAALLLATGSARAASTERTIVSRCGIWSIVTSPNPGSSDNFLRAVAAVSSSDVWAVGHYVTSNGREQTLIEHWNGAKWVVVSSPNIAGTKDNFLNAVAAVSSNDVWAVGIYVTSNDSEYSLIEHWNGTKWSIVSSPNPGSDANFLFGMAAVSSNDVWAVGELVNADPSEDQTLIEHWNGTKWSVVSSPHPGAASNTLKSVAFLSATDGWVVGDYSQSNGHNRTLIEHWNGAKWSVVSSPDVGRFANYLHSVASVSTTNIWAVGYNNVDPGDRADTLVEHWNGTKWSVVSSPSPASANNYLQGVASMPSGNVWAVGYDYGFNSNPRTLVEQWNGRRWSVMGSPNKAAGDAMSAVAVISAHDAWSVGAYSTSNFSFRTLIEHYC